MGVLVFLTDGTTVSADFLADFGGCHPNIQPMAERHRATQSTRSTLFSVGRRIYERELRSIQLSWAFATLGTVQSVQDLWHRTLGGVLSMAYSPDNAESAFTIRFTAPPVVVSTGPISYSMTVQAEELPNK